MRKTIVIGLLVATSCGMLFSQNKKGNLFVGTSLGSAGMNFSHSEYGSPNYPDVSKYDYSGFSISLGPTIGYYVMDDLVLGGTLGVSFSSSKSDSSSTTNTQTSESKYSSVYFSLGPFARYYFGDARGKGRLYAQVSAGMNFYPVYSSKSTPSSGTGYEYKYTKYSAWSASLVVGYEHYINTTIGVQFYLGYSFNHYNQTYVYDYVTGTDYTYNYLSNSHGISFGVGLQIHLDLKAKKT